MSDTDTIDDGHEFLEATSALQSHALGIKHVSKRIWTVFAFDDAGPRSEDAVQAELSARLQDVAFLMLLVGGSVAIVAQRARISDDDYVPYSYAIRWESFAPTIDLRDRPEGPPPPEVVEEPDEPDAPELAGAFATTEPEDLRDEMEAEVAEMTA